MEELLIRDCKKGEEDFIVNKIIEFNSSKLSLEKSYNVIWMNRVIENENKEIVAGIICKMYCDSCIYVDLLWIDERYRKKGLGTKLLTEVETKAKEKGCHLIHLDTFDFQAKDFYLKNGYEIFGTIEDCPHINNKRYYLKKNI